MRKIFTFVIAALSAVTMSAKGDIITFGEADVADKGTWSDGKVFTGEDNLISIKLTDTDSKMAIDANNANFGVAEQYDKFTHRLKTGGKSSAKNAIELTVAEDGEVFFFVRSGNGSDLTRTLVLSQEGNVILSQIVKDEDAVTVAITDTTSTRVFPIYSASVKAGTYAVEYPVNGINFYAFGFSNGSSEGEGEEVGEVVSLVAADFTLSEGASAIDQTAKGIRVEITNGLITANQIRIYKGQTITVSSEKEMSAIVFTCDAVGDAKYGPGCFDPQVGYSYESDQGIWQGKSNSVSFTASANQVRATKIEIYFGGKPGEKELIEVSVAEAIQIGMALENGTSDDIYAVTGYVVNAEPYSLQYNNQIWYMADDTANIRNQEFEAYSCTAEENGAKMQVINGDLVTLVGRLTKYYKTNEDEYIVEIKNGTAAFVTKAEGDHSLPVPTYDTISVAQAIEIGQKLNGGSNTADEYVVAGYAVSVQDPIPGNAYQTWYMADEKNGYGSFQAYQCTPDRQVQLGDYMLVRGRITNYISLVDSASVIEISRGEAVHANAPATEDSTVVTAPAVADLAKMYDLVNNVVYCLQFIEDAEVCNDVYLVGTPNNWGKGDTQAESWDNCQKFTPVPGFDGWYAVEVPYSEGFQGKPIQATDDLSWNWDFQCGDADAWNYVGGNMLDIIAGYANECNVAASAPGAYIYQLKYWKNHKTPCVPIEKHTYTVSVYAPDACEEMVPAIIGDFNNWAEGIPMTASTDKTGRTVYTYTFFDQIEHGFKIKEASDTDWSNELQYFDSEDQTWYVFPNFILGSDSVLVLDFSNNDFYRFAKCTGEEPQTWYMYVRFPEAYCPEDIEIVGTFNDWGGTPLFRNDSAGYYGVEFSARPSDEFMFRVAGSWDNILMTYNRELNQWEELRFYMNWFAGYTSIVIDLSDPTLYKWSAQPEPPQFEDVYVGVSYLDKESNTISTETVMLHVPVAPQISGFTFLKWEVTGDLLYGITIQAVYTADAPESAPEVYTNPANPAQKLIRNGNVYILRGDKTYTVTGQTAR